MILNTNCSLKVPFINMANLSPESMQTNRLPYISPSPGYPCCCCCCCCRYLCSPYTAQPQSCFQPESEFCLELLTMSLVSLNPHRLFYLFSSAKRHVFQVDAQKRPAIFCLDDHVLHRIHEYLSLVDRVCLSLSCKRFFRLHGAVVKHSQLAFPRLLRIMVPLKVGSQSIHETNSFSGLRTTAGPAAGSV